MSTVLAALLTVFLFYAPVHAADKIRIGFAPGASQIPFPLAQKKGFLKEEGFEAEIIRISGTVAVAALVSGEADYFTATAFPVRAAIQGLPLKVVACYIQGSPQTLVARGDFKSVMELKGKTVAIGTPGGNPDRLARLMVKHFGLEPEKDVKFAAGGGGLPEKGFRLLIEEVKELARVNREVSMSEIADLSILREAQKELGVK